MDNNICNDIANMICTTSSQPMDGGSSNGSMRQLTRADRLAGAFLMVVAGLVVLTALTVIPYAIWIVFTSHR